MATYHCSVKVGGKGQASGHAAYIAREDSYAERAGYEDLETTGYGNLPAWAEHEPSRFWSAADRYKRANGATYREIEIALPRAQSRPTASLGPGLHPARDREQHAHQWAIHNPGAALAGGEQPHAHLMYLERTVDGIERVRQILQVVDWWLPHREKGVVADSSFAALELLAALPSKLHVVTRLRLDAALYGPAPERRAGQPGRPRKKGQRLPTLAQVLADLATRWTPLTLPRWCYAA